ncbi:hypothetical protein MHYP_G00360700 [Metynnis hypsauchen]
MAPPQQENLTEETDETKNRLMNTLLDEVETHMEQLLNHPVSTDDDRAKAIRELLEILFADALSANVQPLETVMMVANEAEAEATNKLMSICLEGSEEEPLEKYLDHLVSTNDDAAKAIRELLEILFANALSASVQPLTENEMITEMIAEAKDECMDELISISVEDNVKEPLGNLVSTNDAKARSWRACSMKRSSWRKMFPKE